jgi:peptidoglycan/LPS O-acetylase OafA/YrhL
MRSDVGNSYSAGIRDANLTSDVLLAPATVKSSVSASLEGEGAFVRRSKRIPALDFTKGALVLIMVLYHWLNYFVRADGSIYKYLRFLTPSFIFITGFLISQVYLVNYQTSGRRVQWRLLARGFKLLGIVLCLNIALNAVRLKGFESRLGDWSPGDMAVAYLTGIAPVAFSVLVPIAYLLILSAALLIVSRRYRNIYHVASIVFVACALVFELKGIKSGYLQIFSMGMLGISVGYIPIDRINRLVKRSPAMFVTYLAYLSAITVWDDAYPLQVAGVSLSLAVIYWMGLEGAETNRIRKVVILLGHYSLFAYIAQIVILQVLRRSLAPLGTGVGVSVVAFLAGAAGTILSVEVLDGARIRIDSLNKVYTAMFG